MKTTSIEANKNAEKTGLKKSHKELILQAMDNRVMALTAENLANILRLKKIQINRRLSELEEDGLIYAYGVRKGQTAYLITPKQHVDEQKDRVFIERFKNWQKQAKKYQSVLGKELMDKILNI